MRDILLTAIIFGSIPFILRRPFVGILVWSWISFMNPHRLTWGFAFDMPFAQIVAVATVIGLLLSSEPKRAPSGPIVYLWAAFIVWMAITTALALNPSGAQEQLMKVLKIQFFILLTALVVNSRERIDKLVWVIVISIGFFSVKGGLFTLMTGGGSKVFGPPGGFIGENNSLALATLMVIPLMNYLRIQSGNTWIRRGLLLAMILSVASVLGSHSRGAFLAGLALMVFFWLKSDRKIIVALTLALLIPPLILFMPQEWSERIQTITENRHAETADIESMHARNRAGTLSAPIASRDWLGYWPNDFSALGRVNAWNYSINVANSRLTGAGFDSWSPATFAQYAPIVEEVQAAHSIFFSVLADHGWIGLLLFLGIIGAAWRNARWLVMRGSASADAAWGRDLGRMIQLSLIAYCTGGAFLSLSYYDLPWTLFLMVTLCRLIVEGRLGSAPIGAKGLRPARPAWSR